MLDELRRPHVLAVDFLLEDAEYFGPDGSETRVCTEMSSQRIIASLVEGAQ